MPGERSGSRPEGVTPGAGKAGVPGVPGIPGRGQMACRCCKGNPRVGGSRLSRCPGDAVVPRRLALSGCFSRNVQSAARDSAAGGTPVPGCSGLFGGRTGRVPYIHVPPRGPHPGENLAELYPGTSRRRENRCPRVDARRLAQTMMQGMLRVAW